MMNRRGFVRAVGGAFGALPALPLVPLSGCALESNAARARAQQPVGVQLYTVRREMGRDFEGTLARVAEIGYTEVEFAGYFDRTPQQVRRALQQAGLKSPAAHISLDLLDEAWEETLGSAITIGHQSLVVAWIPQERRTLDGLMRVAALLDRAGEAALRAGLRLGYHNHEFEFTPVDGVVPYDLLLDRTDPARVQFEMDLYWIARGNGDPLAYFAKSPGRFPMVHVKDMDGSADRGQTEVGSGVLDFRGIFAHAAQAGIRHYFVEHDSPASPLESIRKSYQAMVGLLQG
jgi:sugar phosphate isomerase/epimerase